LYDLKNMVIMACEECNLVILGVWYADYTVELCRLL